MSKKGFHNNSASVKSFRAYVLPILEKQHAHALVKHLELFPELWKKYCETYKIDLEKFKKDETLQKRATQKLRMIRFRYGGKRSEKFETNDNYVIFHVKEMADERVVEKKTYDLPKKTRVKNKKSNGSTLALIDEKPADIIQTKKVSTTANTILQKKISEIKFASPITVSTVKRISEMAQFKEYFAKDYLYYLNNGDEDFETMADGRIRKRFKTQLTHIKTSAEMIEALKDTVQEMIELVKSGTMTSDMRRETKANMSLMTDTLAFIRDIDIQPIKFMNLIEEGEFSAQKVLQGAVMNDRAMIDNGQIILEAQAATVLGPESFDDDLKVIGEAILDKQLEEIGEEILAEDEGELVFDEEEILESDDED